MIREDIIDKLIELFKKNSVEFSKTEEAEKKVNTFVKEKIREYATEELLELRKKDPYVFSCGHYQIDLVSLCNDETLGKERVFYFVDKEDAEYEPSIFKYYITDEDRSKLAVLVKDFLNNQEELRELTKEVHNLLGSPYLNSSILRKNIPELFNYIDTPEK